MAATSDWQLQLGDVANAQLRQELLGVLRRYHGSVLPPAAASTGDKEAAAASRPTMTLRCFFSPSDPDLPTEFKGESELLIVLPATYPQKPARLDLGAWRLRMSKGQYRTVTRATAARASELRGVYGLRKLLTWLDNNLLRLLQEAENEAENTQPAPAETSPSGPSQALSPPAPTLSGEEDPADSRPRRLCRFFARGKCNSGAKCKFAHDPARKSVKTSSERRATPVDESRGMVEDDHIPITESTAREEITKDNKKKKSNKKDKEKKPMNENDSAVVESTGDQAPDADAVPAMATTTSNGKKRPSRKRPCKYFAKGKCREGETCKFSHSSKSTKSSEDATNVKSSKGFVVAVIGEQAPSNAQREGATQANTLQSPIVAVVEMKKIPRVEDWTAEEQRALDQALMKYPATMEKKERWLSIAGEVPAKTLNDCIDRFKYVSQCIKNEQTPAIQTPRPAPPTSPRSPNLAAKEETACLCDEDSVNFMETSPPNAKIIPEAERVSIETEPEQRGVQIRLEDLFLYQVGTVIPHRLVCQVQCANCPLKFDAKLALNDARLQKWCPRCSTLHVASLRPVFTHAQSNVLAYVDTDNCDVVDVLPSDVIASCLECGTEALLEGVVPGRRFEKACFSCHTKLAIMLKRYTITDATTSDSKGPSGGSSPRTQAANLTKPKSRRPTETLVLGQPLPRKGACDHYKNSFRWFRFQCCGKAFPCDVCHDSSDCPEANTGKIASKMICGLCSKEQSSSNKECSCGNEVGRKTVRTRHWEGGQGCRDRTRMSHNDKQKFRGLNKTESQKIKRVGVEGKLRAQRTTQ